MKSKDIARLEAQLSAQKIVLFKLFEFLLFTDAPHAAKLTEFLEAYIAESSAEPGDFAQHEAQALQQFADLFRDAIGLRESAAEVRAVLTRAKRPRKPADPGTR